MSPQQCRSGSYNDKKEDDDHYQQWQEHRSVCRTSPHTLCLSNRSALQGQHVHQQHQSPMAYITTLSVNKTGVCPHDDARFLHIRSPRQQECRTIQRIMTVGRASYLPLAHHQAGSVTHRRVHRCRIAPDASCLIDGDGQSSQPGHPTHTTSLYFPQDVPLTGQSLTAKRGQLLTDECIAIE